MKRTANLLTSGVLLVGCGSPGEPSVILGSNADELSRVEYSSSQEEIYKEALVFEMKQIELLEDMEMNYDIPEAEWKPYLVRAKAFCDDARTNGWDSARETYIAQFREQALNALPADVPSEVDVEGLLEEQIDMFLPGQLRAIAAEGSLCPELAPSNFGTVVTDAEPTPTGSPADEGVLLGEGCQGATSALGRLLEGFNEVEAESITPPELYDLLVEVGAGLMYAQATEPNQVAMDSIGLAAEAVAEMGNAVERRDSDASMSAIGRVSEAAIAVLDACESAYP